MGDSDGDNNTDVQGVEIHLVLCHVVTRGIDVSAVALRGVALGAHSIIPHGVGVHAEDDNANDLGVKTQGVSDGTIRQRVRNALILWFVGMEADSKNKRQQSIINNQPS